MSIRVTRSTFDDLDQVVATHLASFPGFFLSALGPRFLREFYAALIRHPQGHLYVAFRDSGANPGVPASMGEYHDTFTRVDGTLLFASREVRPIFVNADAPRPQIGDAK